MTKRPTARKSPVWTIPLDQFKQIVASCFSLSDILRQCGLCPKGANHLTLKKRIKEDNIDISHIVLGRGAAAKRGQLKYRPRLKTLEECMQIVFVAGNDGGKTSVRRYLRQYNLIDEKCRECGLTDSWNGKPLTLQLEHINGDSTDDRLENLCWLCPNCHSQTDTYTGKANRGRKTTKIFALSKPEPQPAPPSRCRRSRPRPQCHKVPHPTREELQTALWQKPFVQLATQYGVASGNTVREWATQMGLELPPKGYWQRRTAGQPHEQALHPRAKSVQNLPLFTADQIREIRRRLAEGSRAAQMAREYDCCHKTMRDIRDGVSYRTVV